MNKIKLVLGFFLLSATQQGYVQGTTAEEFENKGSQIAVALQKEIDRTPDMTLKRLTKPSSMSLTLEGGGTVTITSRGQYKGEEDRIILKRVLFSKVLPLPTPEDNKCIIVLNTSIVRPPPSTFYDSYFFLELDVEDVNDSTPADVSDTL